MTVGCDQRAQAPDKAGFDEVMIVKYKSRFQFFHMALLDWHYWPLMCAAPSVSVRNLVCASKQWRRSALCV